MMTDNLTDEDKVELADWLARHLPGTVKDACMDFMFTDNRALYDKIYPPDEEDLYDAVPRS